MIKNRELSIIYASLFQSVASIVKNIYFCQLFYIFNRTIIWKQHPNQKN